MFRWPSIAIAASALCASVHAAPPSGYKMTILSVDDSSSAFAINNSGDVVGSSVDGIYNGTPRTYLYSSGVLTNIGSLGGGSTTGLAINDAGEIAGMAQDSTGASRPFFYSNGTMNAITSGTEGVALGLNNSGAVVGYLSGASPKPQAFLYQNGTTTMLGSLGLESQALQVNDSGTAVGLAFVDPFTVHAVSYANGQVTDISNGYASVARAINNSGTIAGYVYLDGGSSNSVTPFIYKNGQMDVLGQMYNGGTYVNDINDSGAIVGTEYSGFLTHGFLYTTGPILISITC